MTQEPVQKYICIKSAKGLNVKLVSVREARTGAVGVMGEYRYSAHTVHAAVCTNSVKTLKVKLMSVREARAEVVDTKGGGQLSQIPRSHNHAAYLR